jgi:hypothetical protein
MYDGTLWHTGVTIFAVEMHQCWGKKFIEHEMYILSEIFLILRGIQ